MGSADVLDRNDAAHAARMSDNDVLALRRAFYNDGFISDQEADRILKLAVSYPGESDQWPRFFVEVLTDFLVNQAQPAGYVSDAQADWLIARIAPKGRVPSGPILELVVKILEETTEAPQKLVAFALQQVKTAVLEGDARLIGDATLTPGVIGEAEVALLRRILYAAGGDASIAISRAEAELLFDLNDATRQDESHWSWSDLFTKAIINHLMAINHYHALSREDAMRLARWRDAPPTGVADFLGRVFSGEMTSLKDAYASVRDDDPQWGRLATLYEGEAAAEALTAGEVDWLAKRMGQGRELHENEKAVLRFIRDECPQIHDGLEALLARV